MHSGDIFGEAAAVAVTMVLHVKGEAFRAIWAYSSRFWGFKGEAYAVI